MICYPVELRLVSGEVRLGEPALEIPRRLLLVAGDGVNGLKPGHGLLQPIHAEYL